MRDHSLIVGLIAIGLFTTGTPRAAATEQFSGTISSSGSGYSVQVSINGRDIGLSGGKDETRTLFSVGHPLHRSISQQSHETAHQLFVLQAGTNELSIRYDQIPPKLTPLVIGFIVEGYPAPSFYFVSNNPKGVIHNTLILHSAPPPNFKPHIISDIKDGKVGFAYLATQGCSMTVHLHGLVQGELNGTPGSVPLFGLQPGDNRVRLDYGCQPGVAEVRFVLGGSPEPQYIIRQAPGEEHKETFTVTAQ